LLLLLLHESQLPDAWIGGKRKQTPLKIVIVDTQESLAISFASKLREHCKQAWLKEAACVEPEFTLRAILDRK